MTQTSSSGHAQLDDTLHFGQINLLSERIARHDRNFRISSRVLRWFMLTVLANSVAIPYLMVESQEVADLVSRREAVAKQSKKRATDMTAALADLSPAKSYLDRLDVSRQHLRRWRELIGLMESAAGPGGLVSQFTLRQTPGSVEVQLQAEAASLSATTRLGDALQSDPMTRDLRISDVKPADVLDASTGAVGFELKGKVRLK